ncbi:sporulation-specific diadenylate cyclase CdaS [Paenibacillus sp. NPDC058071]|uniref:sporulation-specific diadenylate cyclase CdaS n=1 Tax=Paenibacillus sp. NPDC058071 TaxID=3346326 RepID=UPI0036DD0DC5
MTAYVTQSASVWIPQAALRTVTGSAASRSPFFSNRVKAAFVGNQYNTHYYAGMNGKDGDRYMIPENCCDFSPLKQELMAEIEMIKQSVNHLSDKLDDDHSCLLGEFEKVKEKVAETEALAAAYYLRCYLSSYTDKFAELSMSIRHMAQRRHGALLVVQRNDPILPLITQGINLNAELTPSLLETIFVPGGPLHDGAVYIREDKIVSAGNVLPLARAVTVETGERKLGTRHRAAIGMTEQSDALVLVVSEETGRTSFSIEGKLYPFAAG